MIKVVNKRIEGSLFHYAHFICDCLFPEILDNIYTYEEVIREKNLHQTIGNFHSIYSDCMKIKNTELIKKDFYTSNTKTIILRKKEDLSKKEYFDIFRNFVFTRYNIKNLEYDINLPEVILIKRGERINLIDDEYLKTINTNVTNGKERREINDIDKLDSYLENKYTNKFKSLYFENLSFSDQIKYFNNAKLIICAHGAVMSNMFFCKEKTVIIEITCNANWKFFETISKILNLNHIKCEKNEYAEIIKLIETISI